MSKLIRKIIKEAIDEFDWVDTSTSNLSGQRLFDTIQEFLQSETNGKYWLEREGDMIMFWDESGIYLDIAKDDFSIDGIKSDIETTIKRIEFTYKEKNVPMSKEKINIVYQMYKEYIDLAKTLEPIIGPINSNINESEEFDWVDTDTSNLSGQTLYDMMSELFKIQNDIYWIENTDLGSLEIWDSGGYYLEYNPEDFTVNRVREDLYAAINDYNIGPSVRMDYSNLARALAPIIGPMEYYH